METIHKEQLKKRMTKENKSWIVSVVNQASSIRNLQGEVGFQVQTNFYSDNGDSFENILHKIELDLMTNLYYGFTEPIQIRITENKH